MSAAASFPPLFDAESLDEWLTSRLNRLRGLSWTPGTAWRTIAHAPASMSGAGPSVDPAWQQMFWLTFLADWACYERPADRVTLHRLGFVLGQFPIGCKVYVVDDPTLGPLPIGYSTWYPIAPALGRMVRERPGLIEDRGLFVPLRTLPSDATVYVFNYSVIPGFKKSAVSRALLASLAMDLKTAAPRDILAVTVSEDGTRVARRLGMDAIGTCVVDGALETLCGLPEPTSA